MSTTSKPRLDHLARAWGYFTGHLTAGDAQTIMLDCRRAAGWYPLLILCDDNVLEEARTVYADHPELPRLIADGCARVEQKWQLHNDELDMACRWAIDLAKEYATAEGIKLTRLDEKADADGGTGGEP